MTEEEQLESLTNAFNVLSTESRRNLKFHYVNNTPVFCGLDADILYVSYEGLP